jgi:hypothetical protein
MVKFLSRLSAIIAVAFIALGSRAISAPDKYTVQVPNGLSLSEIRGYEDWPTVAVSRCVDDCGAKGQPIDRLKVILANPTMIEAYRSGVPGNGKPFPDGSKIVKIIWKPKENAEAPFPVQVPDTLEEVEFIEKDSKKFPDTGGWGYAEFSHDEASDTFKPIGNDAKCGYACHTIVTAKDYIFTAYGKR